MAAKMRLTAKVFYALLVLLMIDALIEMSFVAATVSFLHTRAGRAFQVAYDDSTFSLHGKPANEIADQGHISNGAAGTALILVGIGGLFTFPFLRRDAQTGKATMHSHIMIIFWLILSLLSMLLTFVALVYTFVVTAQHSGQEISLEIASRLNNRPYPNYVAYPVDSWTPENWLAAVLDLDLVYSSDRSLIAQKHHVMMGWRWNLIPMFILGVSVFVMGVRETRARRAMMTQTTSSGKIHDPEAEEYGNQAESPILTPVALVVRKALPQQRVGATV